MRTPLIDSPEIAETMSRLPKWRLTETAIMRLLIALIFVLVSCYVTRAQEPNPADGSNADSIDELVATPVTAQPESVRAALRVIESQDLQTPTEWMNAVNILRKLGAFEEAKGYLDRVASQDLDAAALAKIHEDLGTVELIPLANDKAMMPEARDLVFKIFAAAKTTKRDPKRLRQLIGKLTDPDGETRRVAMVELAGAGAHAVPPLLDAYRANPSGDLFAEMDRALIRLGSGAEDALIAAVGAPDPYIQSVAIRALGHVGTKRARQHLIRPYFVGQFEVTSDAGNALRQLGGKYPTSPGESATYLGRLAKRHLDGQPPFTPEFDDTLEMWTWSAESNNVVFHRLTKQQSAALTAARLARDAYELSPTYENTRALLVSQLQSDQLLGGLDELLPKGVGTAYDFGKTAGAAAVCNALGHCLKEGYDAAAIGAAELIGDLCTNGVGGGNFWTPLTRALQSPNRRVRYAAARAIMKIDPRHAYTGASFMLEALVDLADASGVPGAIVATPRTDVRNRLTGMLGSLGFSVFSATEGNHGLREALRASDYDVMLLSDSTSHPIADETIQQLRKDPRGKLLPVILLARDGRRERTELLASLDDRVIVMPEFGDESALRVRLADVEQMVSGYSVPPARRLAQAKDALDWLTHLAQYSKTYPWYDVMRAQNVALQGTTNPALSTSAVKLLGYLGDEPAQKVLVATASQKDLSVEDRQRAANAFGEAVLRRGLMLRKAEVYGQYDRYNASETEDKETQEILGQILDVIETQTKPTSLSSMNSSSF